MALKRRVDLLRFFLVFLLIQSILFTASVWPSVYWSVVMPFTNWVAATSAWLIMLFDNNVISDGNVVRDLNNGFAVAILSGCNGVEATIVLVSAILAFPSPWLHKLVGILAGIMAVQGLNLIRIISLFYLGQWNIHVFEWAHLYIWQALIMIDVLVFFLIWLRYLPCTPDPSSASS